MAHTNKILERAERAYIDKLSTETDRKDKAINETRCRIYNWMNDQFGSDDFLQYNIGKRNSAGLVEGFWIEIEHHWFKVSIVGANTHMVYWKHCPDCKAWYVASNLHISKPVELGEAIANPIEHNCPPTSPPVCDPEEGECIEIGGIPRKIETYYFPTSGECVTIETEGVKEIKTEPEDEWAQNIANDIIEALCTDGDHHKQWYLNQLLNAFEDRYGSEVLLAVKNNTWDDGVKP